MACMNHCDVLYVDEVTLFLCFTLYFLNIKSF